MHEPGKVADLSDEQLHKNLLSMGSHERKVIAKVLLHLSEFGRRRLYAARGYSSLFSYCVEELHYCDGTAGRRIMAARCVEKFPELLECFLDQSITLSTIVSISRIIDKENKTTILEAVKNKRKSEVESIVAAYLPEKSIREGVKALPSLAHDSVRQSHGGNSKSETTNIHNQSNTPLSVNESDSNSSGAAENHKLFQNENEAIETEVKFEIKLKASASAVKKLRRVQELRGSKESLGDLFELLLDQYLVKNSPEERTKRREHRLKLKHTVACLPSDSDQKDQNKAAEKVNFISRHIPLSIKDQLYNEHEGQCAFIAKDGSRCSCRKGLQVDHVYPYALGGSNSKENLRLLCPTHNRYAARLIFGEAKVKEPTVMYNLC